MTSVSASPAPWQVSPLDVSREEPLRGRPYGLEHLEQSARELAASFQLGGGPNGAAGFGRRLAENAAFLRAAYQRVSTAVRRGEPVAGDAEWLLDNFYIVEEQLREIRDDLPQHYYQELPKLISGEPRVYSLAMELIAHLDSALDEETLYRYIRSFQTVTPLSIGEVWAVPIMLRLGLVENLRRLAAQMLLTRDCQAQARLLAANWRDRHPSAIDFSSVERCAPLVLQLIEHFQDQGGAHLASLKELEQSLADWQLSHHEIVHFEHTRQAANQVSIGNVITTMRLISSLDWVVFFEKASLAEQTLRRDPAAVYARMDFATRDRYRHLVEELGKGSGRDDLAVAEQVVALAHSADVHTPGGDLQKHVGYWLVGDGRARLEALLHYRPALRNRARRWALRNPNYTYFGGVAALTTLAAALILGGAVALDCARAVLLTMAPLALLLASEFATSVMNLIVTRWLPPHLLPKLELKDGVPAELRTLVVVPSLLTNRREIDSLLSHLETHYLASADREMRFALLTDFTDASQPELPQDASLLQHALGGIRRLNAEYDDDARPFYLFHRCRQWNEQEGVWMGHERKRGKLVEFNQLLLRNAETSFHVQEGDLVWLRGPSGATTVKFIITLDADTQLPPGAARTLIGALAHPLNHPRFDPQLRRVVAGFGVLQPRVGVNLGSANQTWFSRLFSNSPGLDPYTTCASDVYQDLFGEGSFTGKGIYDLAAFEQALDDVFPENQILSHDLIEGCHARVGLVSDIVLVDGFPAQYVAEAKRQHRWARGDWQLLPWLLPRTPTAQGWRNNPLSLLSRWKIFDNLRRSLVAPALLAFLLLGWFAAPQAAWLWSLTGLLILAFPLLTQMALLVRFAPHDVSWTNYFQSVWGELARSMVQTAVAIALLPHKAFMMGDAVTRTLWRLLVSRRLLLEWETAAVAERKARASAGWSPGKLAWISLLAIIAVCLLPAAARLAAGFWIGAWLLAPLLVYWLSRPIVANESSINAQQRQQLRQTARHTWAFFETFVGAQDNWLPPDNVQEQPSERVAHRISPTNEGLFLASALVARDFGFLGLSPLIELWEQNLANWLKLDRLHGHFYNWYDTETLQPLLPRYISTVDSGNLAACFIVLRQGVEELRVAPIFDTGLWLGFLDTLELAEDACERFQPVGGRQVGSPQDQLSAALVNLRRIAATAPENCTAWHSTLGELGAAARTIADILPLFATAAKTSTDELAAKARILLRWIEGVQDDAQRLLPWLPIIARSSHSTAARMENSTPPLVGDGSAMGGDDWPELWKLLHAPHSLATLTALEKQASIHCDRLRKQLSSLPGEAGRQALAWLTELREAIHSSTRAAGEMAGRLARFVERLETLVGEMDFRFLYNPQRRLFSIGFNLEDGKLDRSHYDLLCSEARLASYLAIAKGDVEPRHWFQLGRMLTQTAGQTALLSWGGTMFEYLMPHLFQHTFDGSVLAQSSRAAVARQQEYGRQHQVPWGVSESAFGALASNADYQYRSFGVPGLGLKQGLGKDLVVSPYSTMLALDFDPAGAAANLELLTKEGGLGAWGFYDALDYSTDRLPAGTRTLVVRCYMAHHQGMSLLALGNLLFQGCARRRFHAHPLVRAAELLLQERVPLATPRLQPHDDEVAEVVIPRAETDLVSRHLPGVTFAQPRTHLLSNGQYSVMVTSNGGGYSQCRDVAVTRWRADSTRDHWGQFIYLKDVRTERIWSAAYQPTCVEPSAYEVFYSIDKAEFHRRDGEMETRLDVAVSPENNAEVRRLRITNHSAQAREVEVTSYAEVALNSPAADLAHPAFQKLFVQTEFLSATTALLATRRPREARHAPQWALHVIAAGQHASAIQYETSRQPFLGRGRTPRSPAALDLDARLEGAVGTVLDPIFSLRCKVVIPPNESVEIGFATAYPASREEALLLAEQYHDLRGIHRALELAWAYSQVELRHLHLSPAQAHLFQRLAAALLYPDPTRRAATELLLANQQGQSGLWRYGISGDAPILLMHITKSEQIEHVKELLTAREYWRAHGLKVDLVLVNDYPGSYLDALHEQLMDLLNNSPRQPDEKSSGIFVLRGAQIPREDKSLLAAVAAVVLHGDLGSLSRQWESKSAQAPAQVAVAAPKRNRNWLARRIAAAQAVAAPPSVAPPPPNTALPRAAATYQSLPRDLKFWNGLGGFSKDGDEYQIVLRAGANTPQPWSNVLANPKFGCLVTESGGGFTWFGNSRENKLSSWANDPVSDSPAEMLYLRDEKTRQVWSPLPGPGRDRGDYLIQHGQGYSRFSHTHDEISQEVLICVAAEEPVKIVRVRLGNTGVLVRHLSATYYVEWVLGVCREQTQLHLATSIDAASGALLCRNAFHPTLSQQAAFLQVLAADRAYTGDRTEFLGRNGSLQSPAALARPQLSGQTGPGLDPCGVMQTSVTIEPGEEKELVFLLGAEQNLPAAQALLARFSTAESVTRVIAAATAQWDQILGAVQVKTPNPALDLMLNRWLLYQTLSCRFWGRSALYQAGGAYGFRDQLQDSMALVYSRPDLAREHLLRAAARQFEEGDVQHWWHPPEGRGTRTRFSDDYLWLPFVASHYVQTTGDLAVLDATAGFLRSPPLEAAEQERFELPSRSLEEGSLYEHCRRALARGFRLGPHGLPLMGCGDWNDGMNQVGSLGTGESVWVGWFLLTLVKQFAPLMENRGDAAGADELRAKARALRQALEEQAWDGGWYRRAFFDNGAPLGSALNDECQIDSIAQSWAVIAEADPVRARQAMAAALERLVLPAEKLALLFAPPFDHTTLDPGYIKGYPPGIRENGGQYTHAALWLIEALVRLGDGQRAVELFDLINPILHANSIPGAQRYQVEPYVVAADVYGVAPHRGRGGWTWYTGSAAWMYRIGLESILGCKLRGNRISFDPRVPSDWPGFEVTYRRGETTWKFVIQFHDGPFASPQEIELVEDGGQHDIVIPVHRKSE